VTAEIERNSRVSNLIIIRRNESLFLMPLLIWLVTCIMCILVLSVSAQTAVNSCCCPLLKKKICPDGSAKVGAAVTYLARR